MKGILSTVLEFFFGTSSKSGGEIQQKATTQVTIDQNVVNVFRYWLDCELFDLPTIAKNSYTPENFLKFWQTQSIALKEGKLELSEDSRVLFMFQCHYAGYVFDPIDMPNTSMPKSYLASIGLQPVWTKESKNILWHLPSDFDKETIYNLAAMRTLYRERKPSSAKGQTLEEWINARLEFLNNLLEEAFGSDSGISTTNLFELLKKVNQKLANEFWTDEVSRDYIVKNSLPVDGKYDDEYKPHTHKSGQVTFRWRHSFQLDGLDNIQIGPFFVKDLEKTLSLYLSQGEGALSVPLLLYLNGYEKFIKKQQTVIPSSPLNEENFYKSKFKSAPISAWPSDPKYGLSFLQAFVVSESITHGLNNILIPVNGPPGTGKTTLLKDVIAHRFVERTKNIYEAFKKDDDWYQSAASISTIMDASIVVASSNNKAVENISKELPDLKNIFEDYRDEVRHFREVSEEGSWGLFCAVLGNKGNRNRFKKKLSELSWYLSNATDVFEFNKLRKSLSEVTEDGRGRTIHAYLNKQLKDGRLFELKEAITQTSVYRNQALNWFFETMDLVEKGCESRAIIDKFKILTPEDWTEYKDSIDKLVRQWFGSSQDEKKLDATLKKAKSDFEDLLKKSEGYQQNYLVGGIKGGTANNPGVNLSEEGATEEEVIKRIYTSQPFGNLEENETKAKLFGAACRLNEAMILKSRKSIRTNLDLVKKVMDGDTDKMKDDDISKAWSTLFLFFPVVSSSLASIEAQFSTISQKSCIGLSMVDEAGQAINYHVVGLLQRSKHAMLVGDPIQVEPVVSTPIKADLRVAREFMQYEGVEKFAITSSSAQTVADQGGAYVSYIGERKVGMPLLVHRRCNDPMFSISNEMAYGNKMINAKVPEQVDIKNLWIDTSEDMQKNNIRIDGYKNHLEAETALNLLELLVKAFPRAIKDGVFIITPFKDMESTLRKEWVDRSKKREHVEWMVKLLSDEVRSKIESDLNANVLHQAMKDYVNANIGTVHTFQGKEATTVIVCMGATKKAGKRGGVSWVNEKPNLLNVAVTRAKANLHIIGCSNDWDKAEYSKVTFKHGMLPIKNLNRIILSVLKDNEIKHSIQRKEFQIDLADVIKESL